MRTGISPHVVAARPWSAVLAALVLTGLIRAPDGRAQGAAGEPSLPPVGGTWEPVASVGQPSRWRGLLGVGFGREGETVGLALGTGASLGVFRDFFPQHYGAASLGAEGYVGQRGEALDGGVRLLLQSEAVFLHGGIDRSLTDGRTDALLGVSFPVRRGGWPLPGARLRVDWLPGRGHGTVLGGTVPIGQPLAGRTRPRRMAVGLPATPAGSRVPPLAGPAAAAVAELGESTRWLLALHNFFWLAEPRSIGLAAADAEAGEALAGFRARLDARHTPPSGPGAYPREVEHYHRTLERAFGLALGATEAEAVRVGRPYADRARRVALEEILLPYNRTIGRYKRPDLLDGLVARARARFAGWARLHAASTEAPTDEVLAVAAAWLADFEVLRGQIARLPTDSRMHWLPLALALRPEEHRTQEQIDDLVELALGRGFESGNATLYVNAPQFQVELLRTIHDTGSYHVLWIHDYAGFNPAGATDGTAFRQTTQGYLRALLDAVRAYDRTGRMPVYLILLDQHNYELRSSRMWMDLLERPLEHRARLPARDAAMARTVAALQDSLRTAVAGSRRLQAEAAAFGPDWVAGLVKVHVNITNPSDLSFRSLRLLPPIGADNLMRDHRKIVIRDVTEARPTEGEVIFTGAGVGDHYASPTWDDRALLLQGPAALESLEHVRATLAEHGLGGDRLPPPLRPAGRAPGLAAEIAAAEAAGADTRVLTVHNRTGFGEKDATFLQTLLYDLAPAGTLIYVPNGLWTSHHWMAQLVSAALRGCHVYLVAPAGSNAPAYSFPQMSRMQELLARLLQTRDMFGDLIEAAGGDLRIGLFTREAPLDDIPAVLAELEAGYRAEPFLREIFPFTPDMGQALPTARDGRPSEASVVLPEPLPRPPQLHQKIQLIASRDVLRTLASDSVVAGLVRELLSDPAALVVHPTESGPLVGQSRMEPGSRIPRRLEALERSGKIVDPVLYFLSGSMNLNVRSMALDGEVTAAVAGPWSLQAYLDFAYLSGGVTWIQRREQLDELLPPYPPLRRRIARWLQYVM
jgi:hypothetical protein